MLLNRPPGPRSQPIQLFVLSFVPFGTLGGDSIAFIFFSPLFGPLFGPFFGPLFVLLNQDWNFLSKNGPEMVKAGLFLVVDAYACSKFTFAPFFGPFSVPFLMLLNRPQGLRPLLHLRAPRAAAVPGRDPAAQLLARKVLQRPGRTRFRLNAVLAWDYVGNFYKAGWRFNWLFCTRNKLHLKLHHRIKKLLAIFCRKLGGCKCPHSLIMTSEINFSDRLWHVCWLLWQLLKPVHFCNFH